MASIKDNAITILRHVYEKDATLERSLTVADLRKAVKMSPEAFDSADDYLLERRYLNGSMGGDDDAHRWLTSDGVNFIESELKTGNFWTRNKDQILVASITGVITFAAGLATGLLLK